MFREALRRQLLKIIGEQLIPLVLRQEPPNVVLMEPEHLLRTRRDISRHAGSPLKLDNRLRSPMLLQHWHEQQLHATRFPCLQAVVEGEIDWRIGVVKGKGSQPKEEQRPADFLTVPVSGGTFFYTPAGVPYSDGQGIHWERPYPRKEPAVVFWMIILPSGVMCHFCRSTASEHRSQSTTYVRSSSIFHLARMLEAALLEDGADSHILVRAHLQAILVYARQALEQSVQVMPLDPKNAEQELALFEPNLSQDTVQRARYFIESHLQENLTPASVAAHAYLSTYQLERQFQREVGASINEYIIRRRMEAAKNLLQNTDLLIRQVGEMVGYRNQSSFTQIFKRSTGTSPRQYREERH